MPVRRGQQRAAKQQAAQPGQAGNQHAAGGQLAVIDAQALVLTAIVIGFAMTAFVLVLSLRAYVLLGSDHVDGREKTGGEGAA